VRRLIAQVQRLAEKGAARAQQDPMLKQQQKLKREQLQQTKKLLNPSSPSTFAALIVGAESDPESSREAAAVARALKVGGVV
jgi:hypothetical protein